MHITESYLADLNEMQKIAVMDTEGPFMVIAAAGSGKTKVLTSRIVHVLKTKKAEPHQILALTFTNKAAAEMRHRIEAIMGSKAKAIWLGTFHSVFVKLLRREAGSLGYPSHFSIYDSDDSKSLIKQIIKELALDEQVYKPNVILGRMSHAKNRLITPQAYGSDATYQAEDTRMRMPRFSEIFMRYTNYCLQAGAMDFDDLLLQTHTLLYTNPELSAKYQQQFRYLFIDEFQDTNLVQYSIAKKLAAHHHNICVVGDDAQSIYAFRGADIQNILHFASDYPHHQVTKLEQNYRSTQHIVDAANSIISYNDAQLKKKVWTANSLGEPIEVLRCISDIEESQLIADTLIEQKIKNQLLYRDFAILYRTNNQSRNFEEALRKKNIPYRIVGGLSFYQRKEVKDLLAYLRFVVNHNDAEAFKRIINFPKRGIGPTTIHKIFTALSEKNLTLWTLLRNLSNSFSRLTAVAISHFVTFICTISLKLEKEGENAYTIADYVAKESGLLKALYEDKTVEGLTRYGHMQELLNSIKQFVDNAENNDPSLGSFLQEIALITNEYKENTDQDTITLMTIHASKGLEFKYIYLVGMEEDLFPSAMMIGSKADLEEERRLFYVAVTRAQLKLTLSYALSRYRFGKSTHTQPSRFLKEMSLQSKSNLFTAKFIPTTMAKKTTHTVETPSGKIPTQLYSSLSSKHTVSSDLTILQIGNEVNHAHFGEGKVVQLVESTGGRKAVILFHNFGEKTLLLNYAKLEILKTV
ncbi:ATP-dependent helicase [Candidatus Cardinium hertigii]|jgi:DNA helicase-2/ATP-dependent DNA helicase PcrA|uniref:DNA 3'-5' helicase n=1 Tax=Candidatus Cardinium hertigii TaxID=247481 RepID=A0A3N2QBL0_9BACT|nr:UvrD-helicase domain-containing protein [Candidatus Cardinium hertigii]ROT46962.1 ATP-dependent DNA helicase [Candidatus Cardinium hertigii]